MGPYNPRFSPINLCRTNASQECTSRVLIFTTSAASLLSMLVILVRFTRRRYSGEATVESPTGKLLSSLICTLCLVDICYHVPDLLLAMDRDTLPLWAVMRGHTVEDAQLGWNMAYMYAREGMGMISAWWHCTIAWALYSLIVKKRRTLLRVPHHLLVLVLCSAVILVARFFMSEWGGRYGLLASLWLYSLVVIPSCIAGMLYWYSRTICQLRADSQKSVNTRASPARINAFGVTRSMSLSFSLHRDLHAHTRAYTHSGVRTRAHMGRHMRVHTRAHAVQVLAGERREVCVLQSKGYTECDDGGRSDKEMGCVSVRKSEGVCGGRVCAEEGAGGGVRGTHRGDMRQSDTARHCVADAESHRAQYAVQGHGGACGGAGEACVSSGDVAPHREGCEGAGRRHGDVHDDVGGVGDEGEGDDDEDEEYDEYNDEEDEDDDTRHVEEEKMTQGEEAEDERGDEEGGSVRSEDTEGDVEPHQDLIRRLLRISVVIAFVWLFGCLFNMVLWVPWFVYDTLAPFGTFVMRILFTRTVGLMDAVILVGLRTRRHRGARSRVKRRRERLSSYRAQLHKSYVLSLNSIIPRTLATTLGMSRAWKTGDGASVGVGGSRAIAATGV